MSSKRTLEEIVSDIYYGNDFECLKYYTIDELSDLIINGAFSKSFKAKQRLKMYLIYRIKDEGYKIGSRTAD